MQLIGLGWADSLLQPSMSCRSPHSETPSETPSLTPRQVVNAFVPRDLKKHGEQLTTPQIWWDSVVIQCALLPRLSCSVRLQKLTSSYRMKIPESGWMSRMKKVRLTDSLCTTMEKRWLVMWWWTSKLERKSSTKEYGLSLLDRLVRLYHAEKMARHANI